MSEWDHVAIGGALKLTSGFPFPSSLFSEEEGVPLIRIRDIVRSSIETRYLGPYSPSYVVRRGDVLIGMDGDFNVVRWRNEDALLNQRVLKIEVADGSIVDLDFAFYWLAPYIEKVNAATAATTVKHLSTKDVTKAIGRIPGVVAQRKIAAILRSVDDAIEATEALIEKHQQIKAGLMQDLFTRGISTAGRIGPTGEDLPKGWRWAPLGDMAKVVSGITLGGAGPASGPVVPYLRVANVQDGYLALEEIKTIRVSRSVLQELRLLPGDVLMNEGGDFDKLGRGTVWSGEIEDCVHQNHVFRVRTDLSVLNAEYLAFHSECHYGKRYFLISSKQSTNLASINATQLRRYPIALPPLDEQARIVARLSAAKAHLSGLERSVAKLRAQKLGLMQDLLTGRVAVKFPEPAIPA